MRGRARVIAAAACTALLAAGAAGAAGFQTPTRSIGCLAFQGVLRCDIAQTRATPPPKPRSCEFDWGSSLSVTARGRARWGCVSDTVLGSGAVVPYGRTWRSGPFACSVRRVGVRCVNRAGHGMFLSRPRITRF